MCDSEDFLILVVSPNPKILNAFIFSIQKIASSQILLCQKRFRFAYLPTASSNQESQNEIHTRSPTKPSTKPDVIAPGPILRANLCSWEVGVASHSPYRLDAIVSKLGLLVIPCLQAKTIEVVVEHSGRRIVLTLHQMLDSGTRTIRHGQSWIISDCISAEAHGWSRLFQAAGDPLRLLQAVQVFHAGENRVDAILFAADRVGGVDFPNRAERRIER